MLKNIINKQYFCSLFFISDLKLVEMQISLIWKVGECQCKNQSKTKNQRYSIVLTTTMN